MNKLQCLIILMVAGSFQSLLAQGPALRRIEVKASAQEISEWKQEGLLPPHFHYQNGMLETELNTDELMVFKKRRIRFKDITAVYKKEEASLLNSYQQKMSSVPAHFAYGSMGGFYTFQEAMDVLDSMRTAFPQLVSVKDTIGTTYEGRPIVMIRISDYPDSVETDEDEWMMTALHHANEVLGTSVSIYYIWYLLEHYQSDKEIRTLLNNSALHYIPVLNPDGLAYNESTNPAGGGSWRKNRKPRMISSTTHYGVDLNRNYGYNWAYTHAGQLGQAGSNFAGNAYYRGTAAWSEAETQAIRDLCNAHRFTAAFNYHAWDDSFNYPWNYDIDSLTSDSAVFSTIAGYLTAENNFQMGTFNTTLGYTANGTSDDWLYGEQATKPKIFAFTIEVGKSFWPAQGLIPVYGDSLLHANIKMLRMAAKYAAITDTGNDTIHSLSTHSYFDLKRYSIKDTVFTVSLIPISSEIIFTGPSVQYNSLNLLGTKSDSIALVLSPATVNGTIIQYVLKVDNGAWSYTDTISKVFMGHSVLPLDCMDSAEPNNDTGQAKLIHADTRTRAAITGKNDIDWFYFQTTAGKTNIRLILSGLPGDYDMELTDDAGNRIAVADHSFKINDTLVFNTSQAGLYRVKIYGYQQAWNPFRCYLLDLKVSSGPFAPVHRFSDKEKQNSGARFSVFPVPATTEIHIAANSPGTQDITWILTDYSGRQVLSGRNRISRGSSVFSIPVRPLPAGAYVLHIITVMDSRQSVLKVIKQ